MEIAVVGSEEFVVGFRLAGIKKVYGVPWEKLQDTIAELMEKKDIGILAVNTKDLERLPQLFTDRIMNSVDPVVIPVGEDEGDMRAKVRRAMGIDLYKSK